MGKSHRLLITLILLAIFFVGSIWVFKIYYNPPGGGSAYETALQQGDNFLANRQYKEAVSSFQDGLSRAGNKDEKMLAEFEIAFATISVDPPRGVLALKKISLDTAFAPRLRVAAINAVLTYLINYKDRSLAKLEIFTGDTWEEFLIDDDFSLAIRKASEWSAGISSRFVSEYRIASWYVAQIRTGGVNPDQETEYIKIVEERLAKGNVALASVNSTALGAGRDIGLGYLLRGSILEFLADKGLRNYDEVVDSYRTSKNVLEAEGNDLQARSLLAYVRFSLAAFLARTGGGNGTDGEVVEILSPIYEIESLFFGAFVRSSRVSQEMRFDRINIIRLASIDPRFRGYLLAQGWTENDFR